MTDLLFLDYETFLDSKNKYDLRKMSTPEYVRDTRFHVQGLGFCWETTDPEWLSGYSDSGAYLEGVNWSETILIGHNLKFDGFILSEKYEIKPVEYRDTKAMARAVLGKKVEDYRLATLAKFFGLPEKGELKTDGIRDLSPDQEKELSEYCRHDVWLTREIYKRLAQEFPENQYPLVDQTIRMFVEPKLELDVELLEKTAKEEKERRANIFIKLGIDKKEFASNVKFPVLLEANGYEVPTKQSPSTGTKIPALALGDPGFLDLLETEDPKLKELCEARVAAKSTLLETRSEKLRNIGQTGKWSFDCEFSGAAQTHRYSGGGGSGGNPQNFTRDSALREAVQAPKGYSLVVGDFANIEMRLVAYLSQDPGLIQGIENGEDLYCKFASAFYGRTISKADDKERRFGKTAILGLGYGMGPTKFQKTVYLQSPTEDKSGNKIPRQKITIEEAKKAVNLYRSLYYKVPVLWKRLDFLVRYITDKDNELGTITYSDLPVRSRFCSLVLPSGLILQYPNLREEGREWVYDSWGKKGEKVPTKLYGGKLLENISQALAGELCKEVMRKFGDKVVGQVHDEILLISDNPVEDRAELEAAMSEAPEWLPELKLEAEVGYGKTWAQAKKNI